MFHRFRSIHLQRTEGSEIKPELTGARDSTQCNGTQCNGEHRCEVWGWVVSSAPRQRAAADKDLLPSGFSELKVSETEELPPFPSSYWSCKRWRHFFFNWIITDSEELWNGFLTASGSLPLHLASGLTNASLQGACEFSCRRLSNAAPTLPSGTGTISAWVGEVRLTAALGGALGTLPGGCWHTVTQGCWHVVS